MTEVIVPDRKRHVARADGAVQTEFVVVDGRIYARGVLAPALPNATPMGEKTDGDRVCVAYRIADTTQTGDRIEVTLALGPDDLPCFIETRAGETVNITTFAYNVAVVIEAPGA